MDLTDYSLIELLQTAIKSEIESKKVYEKLSERTKNFVLKDRLNFLASEELRHKKFLESLYKRKFPGEDIKIPKDSPVPLPRVNIEDENKSLSDLFFEAMEAEKAAKDFYLDVANKFIDDTEMNEMLKYLAAMEMNHYHILKTERDSIDLFEEYESQWPFIHLGP